MIQNFWSIISYLIKFKKLFFILQELYQFRGIVLSNIILSKQIVGNSKKQEVKEGGGKILIIMDKINTKKRESTLAF